MRVLVADDEASIRRFVEMMLRQLGHSVVAVEDGQRALNAARSEPFDGVVTDINMPFLTGIELLEQLRLDEATQDVPVVLMTSAPTEDSELRGLWLGARRYLTKPVTLAELAEVFPAATATPTG